MSAGGQFSSLLTELTGQQVPSRPTQTNLAARPHSNHAVQSPSVRPASPLKRKFEDVGEAPPSKITKPNLQKLATNNASRPGSANGVTSKPTLLSVNRDASGPPGKSNPQGAPSASSNASSTPTSATASKAPAKGSYRELMAKARAAQTTQTVAPPAIQSPAVKQNKPPLGRRKEERMAARQKAREAAKEGKDPKAAVSSAALAKPSSKARATAQKVEATTKKKKDRPPLEYKGTMRGKAAAPSKSTTDKTGYPPGKKQLAAGYSSASDSEGDAPAGASRYRYAAYSDEEEEEEEEDCGSEGSDAMVGGGFDALEAEEEASLRAARKEDMEALREEEAHRREKLDRKDKLKALAAKAKPQRY